MTVLLFAFILAVKHNKDKKEGKKCSVPRFPMHVRQSLGQWFVESSSSPITKGFEEILC